jgi:hypothetical protein
MRSNAMFSRKIKRFAKRILYGSDWEQIEHEVYMPIVANETDDIPESECINVYGKPKGINCGETFGQLYAQIKALKQTSNELNTQLEDLKLTSEQAKIELGNLRLEVRMERSGNRDKVRMTERTEVKNTQSC